MDDTPEIKPVDFGDYVMVEMFRHGMTNEMYLHKVVGRLRGNSLVRVPINYGPAGSGHEPVLSGDTVDALRVIQCGVCETKVFSIAESDASRIVLFG